MGLDQNLYAVMYLYEFNPKTKKIAIQIKDLEELKGLGFMPKEIKFEVYYWRKSNAIHKWFVDHVQDGKDDCGDYSVSMEQLQGLLDAINNVLGRDDKERLANEISKEYNYDFLPTRSGFFFGNVDYNEWYIEDLKRTKEMLEKLFKKKNKYEGMWFEYSSSW